MNTTSIAKQLLLNRTCMTCSYHDYYYDGGYEENKIYMCDNPVRTMVINKSHVWLDERGTCEEWAS